MARIFITGSADGLGQLAARALLDQGHVVVLHARDEKRRQDALSKLPGAESVLTADLTSLDETKQLAAEANAWGNFDVVIHNAAVYERPGDELFRVNVLAPYVLTCLITKPERLIYLSSGMHEGGHAKLGEIRTDPARLTYSDTKLLVLMLTKAVARKWPDIYANAVDPGWVPTKMGGPHAPDSLEEGYRTQVWLAVSNDPAARVSGRYFHHQQEHAYNHEADDIEQQERLLDLCAEISGVVLAESG